MDLLFGDKIKSILYYEFHKMMSNEKVKDIVCERLQEKLKTTLNVSDVKDVIGEADKDLFIKFRDAEITLD